MKEKKTSLEKLQVKPSKLFNETNNNEKTTKKADKSAKEFSDSIKTGKLYKELKPKKKKLTREKKIENLLRHEINLIILESISYSKTKKKKELTMCSNTY